MLLAGFAGRLWAFALCATAWLFAPAALAQDVRLPLENLPVTDLTAFRPTGDNWQTVGDVSASLEDEGLEATPGTGILVNRSEPGEGEHLVTGWEHGDLELELDYMMPQGSNSGIYFQGRYEIQLYDSWGQHQPTFSDAGGIYQRWDPDRGAGNEGFEGVPPRYNVQRAPGLWNHLRVVFRAPRFDDRGEKTADARFLMVEHNGVVIHENVRVTGPTRAAAFDDEQPQGPLMIQGDHGPVALRNIRFKRYGSERVILSDVRYELHEGEFEQTADYAGVPPNREGSSNGFDAGAGGIEDKFALTFSGTMEIPADGSYRFGLKLNWIDDDPHFEGAARGGGSLSIDGREILIHDGRDDTAAATVTLEKGRVPFELTYFKNRAWSSPHAVLSVDGPGIAYQLLNQPGTLPDPPSYPLIKLEVDAEPVVQRSFVYLGDEKYVEAVNVADPAGIHYAYDLASASPLYFWRGPFVDATAMWHSRGNEQTAVPLTKPISPTPPPPSVAADQNYSFREYRLDEAQRPTFYYTLNGVDVIDKLRPVDTAGGVALRRELELSAGNQAAFDLRLGAGKSVRQRPGGLYEVDGRFLVKVDDGPAPVVRATDGGEELVLPIRVNDGRSVSYTLIW